MKKSKFILGILAASMSTAYATATIDYTNLDSATGRYDAEMTITGGSRETAGNVGIISSTQPTLSGLPAGSDRPLFINKSVINMEDGYVCFLTPDANGNGAVYGEKIINMTGGSVDRLGGGVITEGNNYPTSSDPLKTGYYNSNTNGCPIKTTEKVTINVSGGEVFNLHGGAQFGTSADQDPNYSTELAASGLDAIEQYILSHGGVEAFAVGGDVEINISGTAHITAELHGGGGRYGSVDGKVTINITGGNVDGEAYGGARGSITDNNGIVENGRPYVNETEINISGGEHKADFYGGNSFSSSGGGSGYIKTNANVNISGGTIHGNVYGGGDRDLVEGNTAVVVSGGTIDKDVYGGGEGGIVGGNSLVVLQAGDVKGEIYGSGKDNTTKGTATVQILGGNWSNTQIYGKTDGATVEGGTELIVGAEGVAYNGGLKSISGFDRVTVAKGSKLNLQNGNLFDVAEHNYTITSANMGTEGSAVTTVSLQGQVAVTKPITLNFNTEGRVISGRYKIIDASETANVDTTTNWDSGHVTVNGQGASFEGLVWDGNVLYLDYVSPAADAVMAGNWGVFKASQAFTGTLWGNRANACVLNKTAAPAAVTTDEKGNTIATTAPAPQGVTLAWGTAYGQSARISGVGADYSIYGGAIGLEHHFVSGRSLGAALGYDWGTVSPFGSSDIDQETLHAAVYGRAGIWQLGANSAVAVDWSAAYGDTTSESDLVDGDWTQESLQLDARVSYLRKLNDRTTGSVFAGVQYFAADSDTVDGLEVSSMQNLRAEIGAGISYKLNQKATVYGEASVYNDVMRHNPCVDDGDVCIKGSNPGRTGGTLSVGAQYDLNDDWSVRGGYSFDVAEDSTEHNFNAGAVYKF